MARINLKPAFGGGLLNPNLDFRLGCQARENNGSELGAVACTDWASAGGGPSPRCTDTNSFDPDQYRVLVETRQLLPGAEFSDFRISISAFDRGEGDGLPAFTRWASQNPGMSPFCQDRNFDPEGFVIGLEVVQSA